MTGNDIIAGQGWTFQAALTRVLTNHLPNNINTLVEWGPGYSTLVLLQAISKIEGASLISVEQNSKYLAKLEGALGTNPKWNPILADVHDSWYEPLDSQRLRYSTAPLSLSRQGDFFLVDGRSRNECLMTAAAMSAKDAVFVLDDSARARYQNSLKLFETIDLELRFSVMKIRDSTRDLLEKKKLAVQNTFTGAAVLSPNPDVPESSLNMGWLPDLEDLESNELISLNHALESLNIGSYASLLVWGPRNIGEQIKSRGDRREWEITNVVPHREGGSSSCEVIVRSVTGSLNDQSQDPNNNYASIVGELGHRDVYIIAGHRRNECILSVRQNAKPGTIVMLRQGRDLQCSVGLMFLSEISQIGPWVIARV